MSTQQQAEEMWPKLPRRLPPAAGGDDPTPQRITLMDAVNKQPMAFPVRTRACAHLQPFDLHQYLAKYKETGFRGRCPVCKEPCALGDLAVDPKLERILQEAPAALAIVANPGKWTDEGSPAKDAVVQIVSRPGAPIIITVTEPDKPKELDPSLVSGRQLRAQVQQQKTDRSKESAAPAKPPNDGPRPPAPAPPTARHTSPPKSAVTPRPISPPRSSMKGRGTSPPRQPRANPRPHPRSPSPSRTWAQRPPSPSRRQEDHASPPRGSHRRSPPRARASAGKRSLSPIREDFTLEAKRPRYEPLRGAADASDAGRLRRRDPADDPADLSRRPRPASPDRLPFDRGGFEAGRGGDSGRARAPLPRGESPDAPRTSEALRLRPVSPDPRPERAPLRGLRRPYGEVPPDDVFDERRGVRDAPLRAADPFDAERRDSRPTSHPGRDHRDDRRDRELGDDAERYARR